MNQISEYQLQQLAALSPADQGLVGDMIAFLCWRSERKSDLESLAQARFWRFSFLEAMREGQIRASRDPAGMEVKAAEATVGGVRRPALWQHPPVDGESLVEFHVPVPAGLSNLRLRLSLGIRDGVQVQDRLVAFRVRADGWQVWSRAAWPVTWEPVEIALPFRSGDVLRLAFVTDGLGDHRWAWSVWGEPELVADGVPIGEDPRP